MLTVRVSSSALRGAAAVARAGQGAVGRPAAARSLPRASIAAAHSLRSASTFTQTARAAVAAEAHIRDADSMLASRARVIPRLARVHAGNAVGLGATWRRHLSAGARDKGDDTVVEAEWTEAGGEAAASSAASSASSSSSSSSSEPEVDGGSEAAAPKEPEAVVREDTKERHAFAAETGQLLQIVAHSLYTDRHVFIRELVSNASDALEKARHLQVAGEALQDSGAALEIRIDVDEAAGTFAIQDTGIGLNRDEMVENLGMIARSGSKAFMQEALSKGAAGDLQTSLIGQFGVGFYSAFMVSGDVQVYSASALPGHKAHMWRSAGDGTYEIAEAEGVKRGTRIVVRLNEDCREFANAGTVEEVIKQYSNFVQFPVYVNGKQVNTVQAVWALQPSDVSEEMYDGFYKHISHAFDAPMYRLHFTSDAPIALKALFFVGQQHMEKFNMGLQKPGVSLYSRKVLIEAESSIMPIWLRFVHGVVDSEDIPLNISREGMQDSNLIKRIRNVLTRRFLRFLDQQAKKDEDKYIAFFKEFGRFLKEGCVSDRALAPDIAKLLRYESTHLPAGKLTSLDEYISRMEPTQSSIYYIVANNRSLAESSPYLEAFRGDADEPAGGDAAGAPSGTEVLLLYDGVDDFVMSNLAEYSGRRLVTAEAGHIDLKKDGASTSTGAKEDKGDKGEKEGEGGSGAGGRARLSDAEVKELGDWLMHDALPGRLTTVESTDRLRSSPAVVTDHESAAVRRMMRFVEQAQNDSGTSGTAAPLPPQKLEINPRHPVIRNLLKVRSVDETLAKSVAAQVLDNALVAAGLLDDSREMLPRLNSLLDRLVANVADGAPAVDSKAEAAAPEATPSEGATA